MECDFTLKVFTELLRSFQSGGYSFITFAEYCTFFNSREQEMEGARERGSDLNDISERSELNGEGTTRKREIDKINETLRHCDSAVNFKTEITNPKSQIRNPKFVILRHDVDARPLNSLRTAQIEASLGIRGTYYFRCREGGFEEENIRIIASLGHEIGYHYETVDQAFKIQLTKGTRQLSTDLHKFSTLWNSVYTSVRLCVTKKKSSPEKQIIHHAYQLFVTNLRKLRRITPVSTICMHGSPLSPFNNLDMWKTYDYRKLGILGEPYLDTDFSRVFYLTDTGRRWDGAGMNVRDKVSLKGLRDSERERLRDEDTPRRESDLSELREFREGANNSEIRNRKSEITKVWPHTPCSLPFHSTRDIIHSLQEGTFPDHVMLNVHPQRWNNDWLPWIKELIWQNLKNQVKWLLIKFRG
jgi:hypothetical protein